METEAGGDGPSALGGAVALAVVAPTARSPPRGQYCYSPLCCPHPIVGAPSPGTGAIPAYVTRASKCCVPLLAGSRQGGDRAVVTIGAMEPICLWCKSSPRER